MISLFTVANGKLEGAFVLQHCCCSSRGRLVYLEISMNGVVAQEEVPVEHECPVAGGKICALPEALPSPHLRTEGKCILYAMIHQYLPVISKLLSA